MRLAHSKTDGIVSKVGQAEEEIERKCSQGSKRKNRKHLNDNYLKTKMLCFSGENVLTILEW